MIKLDLEEVKKLLINEQVTYLTIEEGYALDDALEEATYIVEDELSSIDSIEVEDEENLSHYTDSWCNSYWCIKGNYIVTLKDGRKFANYNNEHDSLFEVVELTSYELKEVK